MLLSAVFFSFIICECLLFSWFYFLFSLEQGLAKVGKDRSLLWSQQEVGYLYTILAFALSLCWRHGEDTMDCRSLCPSPVPAQCVYICDVVAIVIPLCSQEN